MNHKTVEGPLGFPLTEEVARHVENTIKALPTAKDYEYRKLAIPGKLASLDHEKRCDTSWISTETLDRHGHIVIAAGMDDSQYARNPIVTLNHDYLNPAVGFSLWRKIGPDEHGVKGVLAKTHYPPRPEGHEGEWRPEAAFTQLLAGLLRGKSVGFLPTATHRADKKEAADRKCPEGTLVVDKWLLLEYACCHLPVNPDTLVTEIHKSATTGRQLAATYQIDNTIRDTIARHLGVI